MGLRGKHALTPDQREAIDPGFSRPPWDFPGLARWERVAAFVEMLTITSGKDAGKSFKLRPFQMEFIKAVYRENKDGVRAVRTAVLSMGRKNGKTQTAAALALCHLCGPEAESRGEAYACANDRFQSARIYDEMVALINRSPYLRKRTNVCRFRKEIEDLENGSRFAALTAEPRTKMGLSPSFCVYDELGSARNRDLYDAMDSAMGARASPLLIAISTQAADDHAPLSQLIDYGKRVNAGDIKDASFHLTLYSAPENANPFSIKAWRAANPALDDFRSLPDVRRLAARARKMPSTESAFRNLILNQRVSAEVRFFDRSTWLGCDGEPVIPDGAKVFGALDLGATRDLSALVLIHQDVEGVFHVQPHIWLPGDVRERAAADRVPYDVWERAGYIEAIGDTTDPAIIARRIAELNGRYRIQTLAFDRWRIGDLQRELNAIGCHVTLVPFGQGFKEMSPAVDCLERLIIQKRVRHGAHPVLLWCATNCVITRDAAGGRKLDKAKSTGRIDPIVALAMAFSLALIRNEPMPDIESMIA